MPQNPSGSRPVRGLPHTRLNLLIAAAKAADTQEGAQAYSEDLVKMLVAARMGKAYINALSRRLAMADLLARHGKRKWVPESSVAQAFNDLMEQVAPTSSQPFQTDTSFVHEMRLALNGISPALGSVDSHSSECLPSEAVLLLWQLLANNGAKLPLPELPRKVGAPKGGYVIGRSISGPDARLLVFQYAASHTRFESVKLYDHVAQLLGF